MNDFKHLNELSKGQIIEQCSSLAKYIAGAGPHSGLGLESPQAYTAQRMGAISTKIKHLVGLAEQFSSLVYGLKDQAGDELDYAVFISEFAPQMKNAEWHCLLSKLHGILQSWSLNKAIIRRGQAIRVYRLWLVIYSLFPHR